MKTFKDINTAMIEIPKVVKLTRPIILKSSSAKKSMIIPLIKHPDSSQNIWLCVGVTQTATKFTYLVQSRSGINLKYIAPRSWEHVTEEAIDWDKVTVTAEKVFKEWAIFKHYPPEQITRYTTAWIAGHTIIEEETPKIDHDRLKAISLKLPYNSPEFKNVWELWMEYRTKRKLSISHKYVIEAFKALKKWAGDDSSLATEIINRSIDKKWQGLFPIPEKNIKEHNKTPIPSDKSMMHELFPTPKVHKITPSKRPYKYSSDFETGAWQKKANQVLLRDNYVCQWCGDTHSIKNAFILTWDENKKPTDHALDNLITVCEDCSDHGKLLKSTLRLNLKKVSKAYKISPDEIWFCTIYPQVIHTKLKKDSLNGFATVYEELTLLGLVKFFGGVKAYI